MKKIALLKSKNLVWGLPLLMMLSMVLLVNTPYFLLNPQQLSSAITLDLVLTIPFIYFLLIRKKAISKITVASVFVVGIIIASYIIPTEHQILLSYIKRFAFPVIEMGVLGFILFKIYRITKTYKITKAESIDFYDALKLSTKEIFPNRIGALLATEIAVVYYSIINWKTYKLKENEFSYYKKSGIKSVIWVLIFLVIIETFAVHIVILKWSHIAATILTFLSLYTCLQLFAMIRSMSKIPIVIKDGKLFLKYGFFSETTIDLEEIEDIKMTARSLPANSGMVKLSPLDMLDSHNIILTLKNEHTLIGFYGIKKTYKSIAIFIDEKEKFVETLEQSK